MNPEKPEWREISIDPIEAQELQAKLDADPQLKLVSYLTKKVIDGNISEEERVKLRDLTHPFIDNFIPGHIDDRSPDEIARNPRKQLRSSD
jgi:hypothetical protein